MKKVYVVSNILKKSTNKANIIYVQKKVFNRLSDNLINIVYSLFDEFHIDSCQGDSGAPILDLGTVDETGQREITQLGLVSWG